MAVVYLILFGLFLLAETGGAGIGGWAGAGGILGGLSVLVAEFIRTRRKHPAQVKADEDKAELRAAVGANTDAITTVSSDLGKISNKVEGLGRSFDEHRHEEMHEVRELSNQFSEMKVEVKGMMEYVRGRLEQDAD